MEKVFVDTSALYALKNITDSFHEKSIEIFRKLGADSDSNLVITNYILCEFINLINMRKGHKVAVESLDFIMSSSIIEIGHISPLIDREARKIFLKHSDCEYSFTDTSSFAFMKMNGIRNVFGFDRHFKDFGFELIGV